MTSDQNTLRAVFEAALAAALPEGKFGGRLPEVPRDRTIVIGAGKAAARMAAAFEDAWGRPVEGLVVTRYDHGAPTRFVEVVEAAHPVPDAAGEKAAERILALARSAGPDDLVVALISGGASALLSLPAAGVTLADKQAINRALLKSGAPIHEMNRVRKALSAIKGGRLAAAAGRAQLVTYLISDVPGDDPATIGSGPTIPEATDPERALAILARYGITAEPRIVAAIRASVVPAAAGGAVHMLATPAMALAAAAEKARALGIATEILGDAIEGEAREVATAMAETVRARQRSRAGVPLMLISGGETTVTVRGKGRGGRNAEFLLALMLALGDDAGVAAIACDTDGIDGLEDNAGAWFGPGDLAMAKAKGLSAEASLADNDAYTFFRDLGRLVTTGPTFTNVNDFRAILIR